MGCDRRSFARGVAVAGTALLAAAPFVFAAPARAAVGESVSEFVGPASCDSTSCHGSTRALDGRARQDEFATWFREDAHRRAFEVLSAPLGQAMGRRLGIDVTAARECLVCHASPSQGATEGANLAEFGVSCEACHGAASGWYGTHFQRGFDRAAAVRELGLVDTKDAAALAMKCLECHLGDATRVVDHRLIAAGHPDLAFEAGSFLLSMSPHWRQRGDASVDWFERAALAGQLVAVRMQMEKLTREAAGHGALDWSSRDCSSCHHDLDDAGWEQLRDWRLDHAMPVPVAQPLFDASRFVPAVAVASALDAVQGAAFAEALAQIERLAHATPFDGAALVQAAKAAAGHAQGSLEMLSERRELDSIAREVAAALARDADRLVGHGLKSAVQSAQLLHSLTATFEVSTWQLEPTGAAATIRARLLAPLDSPRDFRPADLAREWRAFTDRR